MAHYRMSSRDLRYADCIRRPVAGQAGCAYLGHATRFAPSEVLAPHRRYLEMPPERQPCSILNTLPPSRLSPSDDNEPPADGPERQDLVAGVEGAIGGRHPGAAEAGRRQSEKRPLEGGLPGAALTEVSTSSLRRPT
jgi:hypothetical protein